VARIVSTARFSETSLTALLFGGVVFVVEAGPQNNLDRAPQPSDFCSISGSFAMLAAIRF
jgi:hypothetical protein